MVRVCGQPFGWARRCIERPAHRSSGQAETANSSTYRQVSNAICAAAPSTILHRSLVESSSRSHGDGPSGKWDLGNAPKSGNGIAQTTNCIFHSGASGPFSVPSTPSARIFIATAPIRVFAPNPLENRNRRPLPLRLSDSLPSDPLTPIGRLRAKAIDNLLPRAAHLPAVPAT